MEQTVSVVLNWYDQINTILDKKLELKTSFSFAHHSVVNFHLLVSVAYICRMDTVIPG